MNFGRVPGTGGGDAVEGFGFSVSAASVGPLQRLAGVVDGGARQPTPRQQMLRPPTLLNAAERAAENQEHAARARRRICRENDKDQVLRIMFCWVGFVKE